MGIISAMLGSAKISVVVSLLNPEPDVSVSYVEIFAKEFIHTQKTIKKVISAIPLPFGFKSSASVSKFN